jgi:hypothetical protein
MRRLAGAALAAAAVAGLGIAWRASQAPPPPLYDGVCLSASYRLLGHSPEPLSASKSYPAQAAGRFPTDEVTTDGSLTPDNPRYENPAQAQILVMSGTFVSSSPFSIAITPVRAPAAPPAGQAIDGNVYRITATTASGAELQPQPQEPATILLRATSSNPPKTMYRYAGGRWTALKTFNAGCGDTFEAVSPTLGDFALLAAASTAPPSGNNGVPFVPIVIGILIVAAAAAAGLVYLNRGSRR